LTYCSRGFTAGAGTRAREGVGDLHDHGLDGLHLDLAVVGFHRVRDRFGFLVAACELAADQGVRAFDLVADGLADVVQQRRAPGRLHRRAQLGGNHPGQVGALDRVSEHVLAVARAVVEAAEQLGQLRMDLTCVRLERCLLADLGDVSVDLLLGLLVGLLDAGRVDAAVLDQALQRDPGDLAADGSNRTAGPPTGCRR
jgi:hypothetical protein